MKEPFDIKKFLHGAFSLTDQELWGKITNIANIRVILVILVGLALFYGVAFWQGKKSKPVTIDCPKMEGFKATVPCPYSQGDKHDIEIVNGHMTFDGTVIKEKNLPALKPYGIQFKPFVFAGVGTGNGQSSNELGAGASAAKFYRVDLNGYLTDKGFYGGIGYRVTDNCYVVGGYGKDYKNLNERVSVGLKWGF